VKSESLYEDVQKIASISGTSIEDVIEGLRMIAFTGGIIEKAFSYRCFRTNNWLKMHGQPKRRRRKTR